MSGKVASSAGPAPWVGALTAVVMLLLGAYIYIFTIVPAIGLLFIGGPLLPVFRLIVDHMTAWWFLIPTSILELTGMQTRYSGDLHKLSRQERVLIIANHPTRLDWMFLWHFVSRFGRLSNLKIMLKWGLRNIPIIGWTMQALRFFFMHRDWKQDENHVNDLIRYFEVTKYPLQLLVFPEGTNMSEENAEKSAKFAKDNNLPVYKNILHPRVLGFVHLVKRMRNQLDAIYDITMIYDKPYSVSEVDFGKGVMTSANHVHVRRYAMSEMPQDDAALTAWLQKRFAEKEEHLNEFARTGVLHESSRLIPDKFFAVLALVSLALGFLVGSWFLYTRTWLRWYALAAFVFGFVYTKKGRPLDEVEMEKMGISTPAASTKRHKD